MQIWTRYNKKEIEKKLPYLPFKVYNVTLEESDLLINPAYWWHSVKNGKGFVVGIANRLIQWNGIIQKGETWTNEDDRHELFMSFLYVLPVSAKFSGILRKI